MLHSTQYLLFHLNALLVSVCCKDSLEIFALLTAGKGNGTCVYADIFVSWILKLFVLFIIFFLSVVFLYPHSRPTPTTHDPRPLPTTLDPRHLATL